MLLVAVMNIGFERIILSLFLRRLLPTSLLTLLRVSCEMFILLWIGRTVAYRGKHSSTLTFLCVVITEQTARLLAGLYSLALFLSFFSLSLSISTGYFCWGKISSFLSCLSSCLLFGFSICEVYKRLPGFFIAPVILRSSEECSRFNTS